MSEMITPELFNHLVDLAALELDEQEAAYLRRELNNQLKAIQELESIPLGEQAQATSHGVPYTSQNSAPVRADEWRPFSDPQAILEQAPETEDRYLVVPEIPHTELG
jgi:aspartyl/glutamyl-tRNA(Asn/Gln) amidotransferase C subunit